MRNHNRIIIFLIIGLIGLIGLNPSTAHSPLLIDFGDANSFGIITDGLFTATPTTIINGDIGYTALASTPTVNGITYVAPHVMYNSAITDKNAVKDILNNELCDYTNAAAVDLYNDTTHYAGPNNMGSLNVYTPGVYCIGGALSISGDITLSGQGNYIFKVVGAFNTAASVDIVLSNGALACDIAWLGASLTTGANTSLNGSVITTSTITLGADNNISGRLFSSAITTAVNTLITAPNCDFIPPVIQGTNFASGALLPGGTHDLVINYSDIDSGINISSDIIALYKWNGITWGVDISATGLNLGSKVITGISSTYPTNNLGFGKYKYDFHIHDNSRNGSSIGTVFYIDDPEMIVSTGSLDIGLLSTGELIISPGEIIITVKTVGAGFDLILNKTSEMDEINGIEMIDWNGVTGIGYDTDPYSSSINTINTNEILVSNNLNVNINGEKNIHIYKLKIGSLIDYEQAAGIYQASLDIGISLTY